MNLITMKPKDAMNLNPTRFIKWLTHHRGGHAHELKKHCSNYLRLNHPAVLAMRSPEEVASTQPMPPEAGDGLLTPEQRKSLIKAANDPKLIQVELDEPVLAAICAGCGEAHPKHPENPYEVTDDISYCESCADELEEPTAPGELMRLNDQIGSLEEFIEDTGDTIAQLGQAEYDRLCTELQGLYAKRASL